jgi:hypothetical protein
LTIKLKEKRLNCKLIKQLTGNRILMPPCPSGTLFDTPSSICRPEPVTCGPAPDTTTTAVTGTTTTTIGSEETTTTPVGETTTTSEGETTTKSEGETTTKSEGETTTTGGNFHNKSGLFKLTMSCIKPGNTPPTVGTSIPTVPPVIPTVGTPAF